MYELTSNYGLVRYPGKALIRCSRSELPLQKRLCSKEQEQRQIEGSMTDLSFFEF